ncbi:hypothetical protein [Jeotgalibacillus soli]|uniref:Uncharacterized protein n=1 Tax=Jeotgalibacillus soli TaxID=889306 RepID=A0A0C2QWZ0_9BACL|nr:hypothetical protein [Jeotgalibacillus soli]KIL42585.1 hypothetical protein KP78_38080 [Jeotgalibacillus soli]
MRIEQFIFQMGVDRKALTQIMQSVYSSTLQSFHPLLTQLQSIYTYKEAIKLISDHHKKQEEHKQAEMENDLMKSTMSDHLFLYMQMIASFIHSLKTF